jgi:hypothetical protein
VSGELHEISAAIGGLQKGQLDAEIAHREIRDDVRAIREKLSCLPPLVQRVDKIEPKVDRLEKIRQRVIGAAAVASVFSGGIGAWLQTKFGG